MADAWNVYSYVVGNVALALAAGVAGAYVVQSAVSRFRGRRR